MIKKFASSVLCLLMLGIFNVKQTLGVESAAESYRKTKQDKPVKLKGYDDLWRFVESEIESAVRCQQYHTVISISRFNRKTVDAIIERLEANGYHVQTNSNKKVRLAMVVSWGER